ncbi:ribonucleoside-diphosphate reductase subunit M2-like [Adelges cooleyi]|uniref:ribonucleoside-diphosphate reductase subunit M2-like n=1 Tax=Adelges cooleyi TaxID=133065 RepID=UPI002180681C|nr:ribonucleoside-diphosphate reductase subunit M2-like [Adelges cooleyi]XP_050439236.1 ribonucleoside-diphosphate reductase subunit M2-like [Adelges cooleyi]
MTEGMNSNLSEMYSHAATTYVTDPMQKKLLFNAIETRPSVKKKIDWIHKWLTNIKASFEKRLVVIVAAEKILFSGNLAALSSMEKKSPTPSVKLVNETVFKEENLHHNRTLDLFKKLTKKPSQNVIISIIREAIAIEKDFLATSTIDKKYEEISVEQVADQLLVELGCPKIFNSANSNLGSPQIETSVFGSTVINNRSVSASKINKCPRSRKPRRGARIIQRASISSLRNINLKKTFRNKRTRLLSYLPVDKTPKTIIRLKKSK